MARTSSHLPSTVAFEPSPTEPVVAAVLVFRVFVVVAALAQVAAAAAMLVRWDGSKGAVDDQIALLTHSHAQPPADRDAAVERTTFGPFPTRRLPPDGVRPLSNGSEAVALGVSIKRVLTGEPARSDAWQAMAQLALADGQTIANVMSFVEVSRLLSPREGRLMVERSLLALENWSRLDARQREAALQEIVITAASDGEIFQLFAYRSVLARMDGPTRRAIMDQITGYIPLGHAAARRIGAT